MRRAVTVAPCELTLPPGTSIEYRPSALVAAPSPIPSRKTEAPRRGVPFSEVTFPEMVADCCADAAIAANSSGAADAIDNSFFIIRPPVVRITSTPGLSGADSSDWPAATRRVTAEVDQQVRCRQAAWTSLFTVTPTGGVSGLE